MAINNKLEFFRQVLTAVNELPITEVMERYITLVPRGRHFMAKCPFHLSDDERLGAFVVTPDKQMWKCFSCGLGGNGIRFVMELQQIGFVQAVLGIALEHGIVTRDEYESYLRKKYDYQEFKTLEKEAMTLTYAEKERALPELSQLDCVYRSLAAVSPLTEKHKEHLLNVRHIPEERLGDYFSFRTKWKAKTLMELKKEIAKNSNLAEIDLQAIPGFFFDKEKDREDYVAYEGIGMLNKVPADPNGPHDDSNLKVNGIQIRKDAGETRYVWFSSSFAEMKEELEGGNSPGCPGGIVYSYKGKAKTLCITEGKFKAEALASRGNDALYVSGVGNWKPVLEMVKKIHRQYKAVLLMYDADALGNLSVCHQLLSFTEALEKSGIKAGIVVWRKDFGKGIDDLIFNPKVEHVGAISKIVSRETFRSVHEESFRDVLRWYTAKTGRKAVSERDVLKKDAAKFTEILQKWTETFFGVRSMRVGYKRH